MKQPQNRNAKNAGYIQPILSSLLKVFFLIPAAVDVIYCIQIISASLQIYWIIPVNGFELIFLSGMAISIIIYALIVFHNLLTLLNVKRKIAVRYEAFYRHYRIFIKISAVLSASTAITIFIPSFGFFRLDSFDSAILMKISAILLLVILLSTSSYNRIMQLLSGSLFIGTLIFISLFLYGLLQEFIPHQYFTFPLNDPHGRYVLNYDGDYWLTYYEIKQSCTDTPEGIQRCKVEQIKKGNTAITEAPEELSKYLDQAVKVEGDFIATHGLFSRGGKEFCINRKGNKACHESTGPGYWHASPLIITSIRLE